MTVTHARLHQLKCDPQMWPRLLDGSKRFEIRRNDRGYQTGDLLHIYQLRAGDEQGDCSNPFCSMNWSALTRLCLPFDVTYVAAGQCFGLDLGRYAVLSLREAGARADWPGVWRVYCEADGLLVGRVQYQGSDDPPDTKEFPELGLHMELCMSRVDGRNLVHTRIFQPGGYPTGQVEVRARRGYDRG